MSTRKAMPQSLKKQLMTDVEALVGKYKTLGMSESDIKDVLRTFAANTLSQVPSAQFNDATMIQETALAQQ